VDDTARASPHINTPAGGGDDALHPVPIPVSGTGHFRQALLGHFCQAPKLIQYFRAHGRRRDALIITIFYTCALRPGELFALKWNDRSPDRPDQLRIDETFGKSGLDTPKTAQSKGRVYLPPPVQSEPQAWRDWCGDVDPESWIFPSKRSTPIAYDNYLDRTLQPAAEACGVGEITHQVLRRTFSTVTVDSGASLKDVQGQMRHTQAAMGLYYAKAIPKSVAEEVDKLTDRLLQKARLQPQDNPPSVVSPKLKSLK
jgi:integrase